MQAKINAMKTQDAANYPKNALIYMMALTNTSFFGVRQRFKKQWVNLTRKWKTDNIKDHLAILEDKIQVKAEDSQRTIALKKMLAEQLYTVKQDFHHQQAQSLGLVA